MKKGENIIVMLMLLLAAWMISRDCHAVDIVPDLSGNGSSDSVVVFFEVFDTTSLPQLADADSLMILRYGPDGGLVDSLGENSSSVIKPRTGSYEVHLKSSDGSSSAGRYTVRVYAYKGGQIRGASSSGYYVLDCSQSTLDSSALNINSVLDTLNDGFASQTNQENLDIEVSTRSILTADDNIGIDWQDIENINTFQIFPGTYIAGLQNPVNVDTVKIARSVWNDDVVPESERVVDLSGCQSGSGAYACSLYVYDLADSSATQGVTLRIMNQSQTSTLAMGLTDLEGLFVASLDQAMYMVWPYKSGLSFEILPDTIDLAGESLVDTIWASSFDPGDPVSPQLCRVYGRVYDLSGQSLAGVTVSARISDNGLRYNGAAISPYSRSAVSDSTGYWYIDLFPNEVLSPSGSEYEFVIYYDPGRIVRLKTSVPDLASWELNW